MSVSNDKTRTQLTIEKDLKRFLKIWLKMKNAHLTTLLSKY